MSGSGLRLSAAVPLSEGRMRMPQNRSLPSSGLPGEGLPDGGVSVPGVCLHLPEGCVPVPEESFNSKKIDKRYVL